MWRNPRVVALTTHPLHSAGVTDRLLPALLRDCKPHWKCVPRSPCATRRCLTCLHTALLRATAGRRSPTVNSMTGRLLDLLQQSAPDQLAACAARRWGAEKWAAALQEYRDALTRAGGVAAEPTPVRVSRGSHARCCVLTAALLRCRRAWPCRRCPRRCRT